MPQHSTAALSTNPTFAAAQASLVARRAAREAHAAHLSAHRASHSTLTTRVHSLPLPLRVVGQTALSAWDGLWEGGGLAGGSRPTFRVGQLDAELLDEELLELLSNQVRDALKHLGGHVADDWSAEISLALRAVLFKLTVWDKDATYGASLQNLRFVDARPRHGSAIAGAARPPSRWQKGAYGFVTVLGAYAWTKWEAWLLDNEAWLRQSESDDDAHGDDALDFDSSDVRRSHQDVTTARGKRWLPTARQASLWLATLTEKLSNLHAIASLVSFLAFLRYGHYRTVIDRVLRLQLAPRAAAVDRQVSLEYLNRQLVWHAMTEFLLFLLPLVGINRWRRWAVHAWRRSKELASNNLSSSSIDSDDWNHSKKGGELAFLPERTCAICYQDKNAAVAAENEALAAAAGGGGVVGSAETDVTNPYEAVPCGCVYCYVCLVKRIEEEEGEGWTCLRCEAIVKECKPWNGDVASSNKDDTRDSVMILKDGALPKDSQIRVEELKMNEKVFEDNESEGYEEEEDMFGDVNSDFEDGVS